MESDIVFAATDVLQSTATTSGRITFIFGCPLFKVYLSQRVIDDSCCDSMLSNCVEIEVGLRSPFALQYSRILDTRPRQGRIIPHDDATQKKTVEPPKNTRTP